MQTQLLSILFVCFRVACGLGSVVLVGLSGYLAWDVVDDWRKFWWSWSSALGKVAFILFLLILAAVTGAIAILAEG